MLEITDKGLVIERLDAILNRISERLRSIYGQDVDISPDTQDGQIIGIYSQGLADINEAIASVYAMSDPTKAVGVWLDVQLKYVGSTRVKPKYTYLNNVEINAQVGSIIPTGYTVTDENGNDWVVVSGGSAISGSIFRFRSAEYGVFNLPETAVLNPKTIVLGINSVTSRSRPQLGNLQESDTEALARFLRSYQQNNTNDVLGLEGALLALPDVRDVIIYENCSNAVDAYGVAARSINVVILGGDTTEIAETIRRKKTMGCGLQGAIKHVLHYKNMDRPVLFDRTTKVDIKAKITVVRKNSSSSVDIQTIKDEASQAKFLISEDAVAGSLYCELHADSFKVKSIKLSGKSLNNVDIIPIGFREYASISPENVEVLIE